MTHDEAMEGHPVSRAEALDELEKHDADIEAFFLDVGDKAEYNSREVLAWLGY